MMDVSDGLAKDLPALAPPGAVAALEAASLPRRSGASVGEALGDGEDYELVFSVTGRARPSSLERKWARAFPRTRLSCIGRFVRQGALPEGALDLGNYRGYEHLR
jgi:thiamine-monophosphate kinase